MLISELREGLLNASATDVAEVFGKDANEVVKWLMLALDMETPRKPVRDSVQEYKYYIVRYCCPICGGKLPLLPTSHCRTCGQSLSKLED